MENIGKRLQEANDAIQFADDIEQMETYRKLEQMKQERTINNILVGIDHVG